MARSPAATLGERANADLQRIFDGPAYQRCFYDTQIPATANVTSEQRYKRNSSLIEFVGAGEGSFCNTTVNGHTGSVAMLAAMRRALPNKRTPSGHPLRVRKLYLSSGSLDRAARDIGGWPPCRL